MPVMAAVESTPATVESMSIEITSAQQSKESVARANAWLRIRRLETMGARGRMAQAYADGADGADHILTGLDLAQLAPDTGGGFGVGLD